MNAKRDRTPKTTAASYFDRQPPFDSRAEMGVLGSVFLLPEVLDDISLLLRADAFYDDAHGRLFASSTYSIRNRARVARRVQRLAGTRVRTLPDSFQNS